MVERRNRIVLNVARITIKQKNLPHNFWGEAVTTTTYLWNIYPTKRLKEKVLEEYWSSRKPTVGNLRMFGSLCFKHVPDEKRKKLQDKSEAMILVGYHATSAYRLYNLAKQKN